MTRILGIELRRSAALGAALAVAVAGVALLFLVDPTLFTTGWMQLVMTQRLYLAVLWPLALAAGAWQARRERRSNVTELFATVPRPHAQRVVPTLGAMAVAMAGGYLTVGLAGGLWIVGTARYLPAASVAVPAVGVLALITAAWLGLAIGRLLPWPMTAPALGVAGLGLLLAIPFLTRPRGWLALVFSPITEMNMPGAYATVPGRASLAQAVWLACLAGAAVLLLVSTGWRLRVAAVLPVAVGAMLAVLVMPHQNRLVIDAIDPVARELVCTPDEPQICVSRVHSGLLAEVTGPARQGLAALGQLPDAPTRVHEDTTTYVPAHYPTWRADVVLLRIEVGRDGHLADRTGVAAELALAAFASPPRCEHVVPPAEQLAAAHWLLGRPPVTPEFHEPEAAATATRLWQDLRRLPDGEATTRVGALRRAALTCAAGDGLLSRSPR
ncbi:hypothetical protein K7640_10380 [Micromonospora sp. PLK6-60]|uniref:hypothetical protein n=1 Tax=Micromonospora sp. PLK6-60 TaxID=2873383 RepID=UPI001CA70060|nr:hypothetical protein [Micromonospora sp. PLK6-60]MBY8872245.1 hypothetical protein [Micromonospora sp. PLK6-60]